MLYNPKGQKLHSGKTGEASTIGEMLQHLAAAVKIHDQQYQTMRGVLGNQQKEIRELKEKVEFLEKKIKSKDPNWPRT